jgi:hypothetical protein
VGARHRASLLKKVQPACQSYPVKEAPEGAYRKGTGCGIYFEITVYIARFDSVVNPLCQVFFCVYLQRVKVFLWITMIFSGFFHVGER